MPYSDSVYIVVNKSTFSVAPFTNARAAYKAVCWLTGRKFSTVQAVKMVKALKESSTRQQHYVGNGSGYSDVVVSKREPKKDFSV